MNTVIVGQGFVGYSAATKCNFLKYKPGIILAVKHLKFS